MSKPWKPAPAPRTKAEALARVAALERRVRRLEQQLAKAVPRAREAERESAAAARAGAQALTESLDRQTATADILRAISHARTDPQPVFEAIVDSAVRLFGAWTATVYRYDGELLSMMAARGGLPGSADAIHERLRVPHRPDHSPEQPVLTKRVVHVADVETDPTCSAEFRGIAAARGFRSFLSVPMLRGADPLGLVTVGRAQPGAFSCAEIALLRTFADQASIAIATCNTR